MALDSKRKRGSVMELTMPHRQWLAEPDGALADTDRVALLKLASAVAPGAGSSALPFFMQYDLLHGGMQEKTGGMQ